VGLDELVLGAQCRDRGAHVVGPAVGEVVVGDHPPWGFEWTYEGESPQQLALAILHDHIGDGPRAIRLSEPFMRRVIANLDNDWTLTSDEIRVAIDEIEAAKQGA
jgi:hypothetical protein